MDVFHFAAQKLDFSKILDRLITLASSELGKEALRNISPCSRLDDVSTEMNRTMEMKQILEGEGSFPIDGIKDVRNALQRASIESSTLSAQELLHIAQSLMAARNIKSFIQKRQDRTNELSAITSTFLINNEIEFNIFQAIGDDFSVKDSASRLLRSIRQGIAQKRDHITRTLEKILKAVSDQGMTRDHIITTRDGRMVIPIKSELKNKFPGFIHSSSASGQTVYIEPSETLTLNNEITELLFKEQIEISRILRELTDQVRLDAERINLIINGLKILDITYAKARYSIQLRGNVPKIKEYGALKISLGYHPVLLMRHDVQTIVPLNVEIGHSFQTLLISGPNAGGKTVALKTIGLLSLMVRYGLHIPASPDSEIPLYDGIFVLIGDSQSIENDLSTFSSQVIQLKRIVDLISPNCLVLIDEIGSSTDPAEGGALAAATLKYFTNKKATTIATTHQTLLKAFVQNNEGMENGAMEFDQTTLLPTYHFKKGIPGSSYALEIAKRLDMNAQILQDAKIIQGEQSSRLELLLIDLEKKSQDLKDKLYELDHKLLIQKEQQRELETKLKESKSESRKIKQKAIEDAAELVQQLRIEIEKATKQLISKDDIKKAKSILENINTKVAKQELDISAPEAETELLTLPIDIDDMVTLRSGGQTGIVLSPPDKEGNLLVGFNSIKAKIHVQNILKVVKKNAEKIAVSDYIVKDKQFSNEVDVRGLYGDDAISTVDKFLDDAVLSGLQSIHIIHGKGTGALRKKITAFLSKDDRIRSFRMGEWNEGGAGITVVEIF